MTAQETAAPRIVPAWQRALPWLVTFVCFTYLYFQIDRQAGRQGQSALGLLAHVFGNVDWLRWLALMVPYSALFFLIDSLVVWRVVTWFNTRVSYASILPIRASAYIISILNEQVGKGAMAMYLNRRDGVPGWQVASSMLFIMFCEFYYLLGWGTLGTWLQWERVPAVFHWLPQIALGAAVFFAGWVAFFRGALAPSVALRDRQIFHAFRQARWWQYLVVILLRSPALIAAVFVYTHALRLFGVDASYGELLGYLPIIFFGAAVPGPFRAVAVAMWPLLYPEHKAELTAFGLVQHNFFILFNAAIGLCFLRRANRDLFS
ncbi:MAG TPA: hypothetical protein VFY49_16020 [Myxococcota bacterium]|nr:hypothetical protein [Myxococcota bacterium]